MSKPKPLSIFISYSHKDEQYRSDFHDHLAPLRKSDLIDAWYDRKIKPGEDGDKEIDAHLDGADIIVLLVSSSFVSSIYCWERELARALDRDEAGEAVVIPIIVRPVHLKNVPFAHLQALPKDRKPVTTWSNQDEAWVDVVDGIQATVDKINEKRQRQDEPHDVERIGTVVRQQIGEVVRQRGAEPIASLLLQTVDRIDELYRKHGTVTGVATGFVDLDEKTSGLQPSDLIVIAGRPSMGKTALALNIAEYAAVGNKVPVAIFSMEMPGTQLSMRMMASLGRFNAHTVRTGKIVDDDWPRLTAAMSLLSEAPIFIDGTPTLNATELKSRAIQIKQEHGLGLVIVDYLQLMQSNDGASSSKGRATAFSKIIRAMKALAKELNVPVIVISQLNRSVEQRVDKRPVMSDLREYGTIDEEADVILFVYRDEVYDEDSPNKGAAEIIIAKQRSGPVGKVTLTFLGEYTKFENYISGSFER